MNWDDVRLFVCIAQCGSFRQAAQTLALGHSTLSRRMDALEKSLGVKLFNRLNRGLTVTSAGQKMLDAAAPIARQFDQLKVHLSGLDNEPSGKIVFTTSEVFIDHFLLPALENFMLRWPKIHLEVISSMALLDIAAVQADVAIRITNTPAEQLIGRRLGPYCEAAYASKAYLAEFIKQPKEHRFISPGNDYQIEVCLLAQYMAPLKTALICDDINIQTSSAVNGFGVACLPCVVGDKIPQLVCISNVLQRASIWLLGHKDSRDNKRMQLFRDFICQHFENNQHLLTGQQSDGPRSTQLS